MDSHSMRGGKQMRNTFNKMKTVPHSSVSLHLTHEPIFLAAQDGYFTDVGQVPAVGGQLPHHDLCYVQ